MIEIIDGVGHPAGPDTWPIELHLKDVRLRAVFNRLRSSRRRISGQQRKSTRIRAQSTYDHSGRGPAPHTYKERRRETSGSSPHSDGCVLLP